MIVFIAFLALTSHSVLFANVTESTSFATNINENVTDTVNVTEVSNVTEVANVTEMTTLPTTTATLYNCSESCLPPSPPTTVSPLCNSNGTDGLGSNDSMTSLPCCSGIINNNVTDLTSCNGTSEDCVNMTDTENMCNETDVTCIVNNITCNNSKNCGEKIERDIECPNTTDVSMMEDIDSCDRTTGKCLYGCTEKYLAGPYCNLSCKNDLNCDQCAYDQEGDKAVCGVCLPQFFKQSGICQECPKQCHVLNASLQRCDMEDGSCPYGCKDGYYGLKCVDVCHALCRPKVCEQFGGCCSNDTCFRRDYCGCTCSTFCDKKCLGGTCNKDCTCEKGCEPDGYYGPKCGQTCSTNCLAVPDNATQTCNDSNGNCLDGCIRSNLWGPMCEKNCSINCANDTCDRDSGNCTYGCVSQTVYGMDCSNNCSSTCLNSRCERWSGDCTKGCKAGYHGVKCDQICSPSCLNEECNQTSGVCTLGCVNGLFDIKCDRNCSFKCLNNTCDFNSGKCSLGCVECYIGDFCEEECPKKHWIFVAIGCGAFVIIGITLLMVWGKRRIRYRRRRRGSNRHMFRKEKLVNDDDDRDMVGFENPTAMELLVKKSNNRLFLEEVLNRTMTHYKDEFKKLITGLDKDESKYKAAKELDNVSKNLYNDALPYDKNRVILEVSGEAADDIFKTETDYINASYIDGFDQKKRYIAAQGPSEETVSDFWKMVWQQKTFLIVMMNVIPKSYSQIIKYWPEEGKKMKYGEISIETEKTKLFADFITRNLKLTKGEESRAFQHLQFLRWPDQGVPPSAVEIIEFHQKFRAMDIAQHERTNPIVVHCTNGIERTGVFIALDIIVDEVMKTKISEVDVFATVNTLREQRADMVKTIAQYKFLFEAAAQKVAFGCALLNRTDIEKEYERLQEINKEDGKMKIRQLFESCITSLMLDDNGIPEFDQIQEKGRKNRPTSDIPDVKYRVFIENVSYINAVYLDTYTRTNGIVSTQMPSPQTIQDFCQMVIQQDCGVIVMLNIANSQDQSMAIYWEGSMEYGNIRVVLKRRAIQKVLVIRQLEFVLQKKDGSVQTHEVTMIQFTAWLPDRPLPSIESMLELLSETRKYMTKAPSRRLLVHCLNGTDQTGPFCVLYNLFEKVAEEEFVNVVSTVRKVTSRRPSAIQKLDTFKFCYSTLINYLRSVTDYHTYAVTVKEIKDLPTVQDDDDENMYAIVVKVMKDKTEKMADGNDVYAGINKSKKHAHFEDRADTYIDMNRVKKDEDGDADMYMSMSGKNKN